VAPHRQGVHYGQAQLRTLGLQKGQLLDQILALPLRIFLPLIGVGCSVERALEVCLDHVPSQARIHEPTL
jgi:hypothetical protein